MAASNKHEHDVACSFGSPTCPAFGEAEPRPESLWKRIRTALGRSRRGHE